ncbi:hypothetical protein ACHAL6_05040 [Proteiniclasticum sp. C24MP]|uniref:hypothetical protein n=1 Tax=Proteiniclasticum sp. C24MP TaxID=3374101 RepID=UPI003754FB29
MAVSREKEIVVDKDIKEVFSVIENEFRKKTETVMEERELLDDTGTFRILFKRSVLSNGEYLDVTLEKTEEEKTRISMVSRSKVEKTVHDWGKNDKNIRLILELMGVVPKREKKGVYYPGRK